MLLNSWEKTMTKFTKNQLELQSYIKAENQKWTNWVNEDPDNRISCMIVTDLKHWADYGITTIIDYKKYLLAEDIKSASGSYGSKIRLDFSNYTLKELEEMADYECNQANIAFEREREIKKENASNLYKRIKETCKMGARNYKTAIRWILEADGIENDPCYEGTQICYNLDIDYRYSKLFKTARVA